MGNNKANFRKKAESISSMPSANAWEKLEEKLEKASPKKKSIRLYPMLAVAASFLLLFGLLINNKYVTNSVETASFTEATLEDADMHIALVYNDAGTYQSFYEKVAEARTGGILEKYRR